MTDGASAGASLRIELFADDLEAFVDFYTRVLRFQLVADRRTNENPYAAVARGSVRIGAVRPWAPVERQHRTVPTGTEIVVEVDDVDAEYRHVISSGWQVADGLQRRPWGLTDFRLSDPDGYYLRITDR